MSFEPKGIIVAMVTPFTKDGQVNERKLREIVDYLVDNGVHGLFTLGSQGEAYALEKEERKRIMEIVVDQAQNRVPVYVGTGAITTRETVFLTKMAEKIGADAVSVVTPFFVSPSDNELYEHYLAVAKSTNLPTILYNIPGRTGVNLSVDLVIHLSRVDNVVGIKDSSGDLTLTARYIMSTDKNFHVLAGRDSLILGTLLYGGKGAIAAIANVAPRVIVRIYEAFVQGDLEEARKAQLEILPLRLAFGLGTFPVVIKEALSLIGIDVGPTRAPVKSLDDAKKKELKKILQSMNLL